MPSMLLAELGQNALLVLALVAAYGVVMRRQAGTGPRRAVLVGGLFGVMSVVAMAMPVHLAPGFQMDGRGIVLSAGAAVGGPLAGAVAASAAAAYRLHLGGAGAACGLLGIALAALGGIAVHRYTGRFPRPPRSLEFLALGLYDAASFTLVVAMAPAEFTAPLSPAFLPAYWLVMPPVMWMVGALLNDTREFRQKTRLFEKTLETMNQGMLMFDENLRLLAHNRRAAELLDLPPHLLAPGRSGREMLLFNARRGEYGPGDPERLADERLRGMASATFARVERVRPGGAVIEMMHGPMSDGGFLAVYSDVTEWRRVEAALRESERRLRSFAEVASDWFWEMDADLRFTWFSDRIEATLGVPAHLYIGSTREEIGAPGVDPEAWRQHLTALREHKPFRDFEYPMQSPNGVRWLRISGDPVFGEDGAFRGYRGTGRDLTEQVDAERGAREARDRLVEALDTASEGLALFDAADRLVFANVEYRRLAPGAEEALAEGATFEQLLRTVVERHLVADAVGREEDWIAERLRCHRNPDGPVEFRRDDRWMRVRERRTPDGGTTIVLSDITADKRREAQLRRAREEAERANRAKSEFLANMSHELRTPLNAIIGFSEVMKDALFGPVGNPTYLEYASDIHAAGLHLLAIINDILDLAKIEAGRLALTEGEFDTGAAIEEALRTIEPQAKAAGVALRMTPPPEPVRLRGDVRAVKQILLNLLSNAVKFTPAGGDVDISLRLHAEGALEIAVGDTGVGIEPDQMELVMQPFGQAASALSRKTGGTGLGLPIARSLAKLHGGGLALASAPGRGTTATLLFPPDRVVSAGVATGSDAR